MNEQSSTNAPATVTGKLEKQQARLMPEFITELYHAANSGARTIRKTVEGVERTVDGLDEITTLMLKQQRQRLLTELAPA